MEITRYEGDGGEPSQPWMQQVISSVFMWHVTSWQLLLFPVMSPETSRSLFHHLEILLGSLDDQLELTRHYWRLTNDQRSCWSFNGPVEVCGAPVRDVSVCRPLQELLSLSGPNILNMATIRSGLGLRRRWRVGLYSFGQVIANS